MQSKTGEKVPTICGSDNPNCFHSQYRKKAQCSKLHANEKLITEPKEITTFTSRTHAGQSVMRAALFVKLMKHCSPCLSSV